MESNSKAIEGRSSAPCSPSSLTPETDEAWKAVSRTPDGMYDSRVPISAFAYAMSHHSKKMELERNAYRKMCERAYSIAMGDADATEVDDFIADFESMQSPENSEL